VSGRHSTPYKAGKQEVTVNTF